MREVFLSLTFYSRRSNVVPGILFAPKFRTSVSPTIGRARLFSITLFLLVGIGRCQMTQLPISPVDRKIDELGVEDRIQSEDDANSYVQALIDRVGFEKKGLSQL